MGITAAKKQIMTHTSWVITCSVSVVVMFRTRHNLFVCYLLYTTDYLKGDMLQLSCLLVRQSWIGDSLFVFLNGRWQYQLKESLTCAALCKPERHISHKRSIAYAFKLYFQLFQKTSRRGISINGGFTFVIKFEEFLRALFPLNHIVSYQYYDGHCPSSEVDYICRYPTFQDMTLLWWGDWLSSWRTTPVVQ